MYLCTVIINNGLARLDRHICCGWARKGCGNGSIKLVG